MCFPAPGETMKLTYVIKFVGDMDRAVAFHRDTLGLPLKFASPHWSEFATGETTLALHPASEKNPAGTIELGIGVPDLQKFIRGDGSQGRDLQHASDEAGFWRHAVPFCGLGRRPCERLRNVVSVSRPHLPQGALRPPSCCANLALERSLPGARSSVCREQAVRAGVAQLVEHLICNQRVGGSSPFASSSP